jgi:hypothetical protein
LLQHGHFTDLTQILAETLFGRERDGGLHDWVPSSGLRGGCLCARRKLPALHRIKNRNL